MMSFELGCVGLLGLLGLLGLFGLLGPLEHSTSVVICKLRICSILHTCSRKPCPSVESLGTLCNYDFATRGRFSGGLAGALRLPEEK